MKCCKLLDGERFFSFNLDDLGHDRVAEVFSCPAKHTTQFFFVQPWIAFDSAQVVGLQAHLDGHLPSFTNQENQAGIVQVTFLGSCGQPRHFVIQLLIKWIHIACCFWSLGIAIERLSNVIPHHEIWSLLDQSVHTSPYIDPSAKGRWEAGRKVAMRDAPGSQFAEPHYIVFFFSDFKR